MQIVEHSVLQDFVYRYETIKEFSLEESPHVIFGLESDNHSLLVQPIPRSFYCGNNRKGECSECHLELLYIRQDINLTN